MTDRLKKATRHTNQNEGLIFEKSSAGKAAWNLPPLDVPEVDAAKLLVDFLISPEGQKIFSDNDYIPVDPNVPAKSANLNPEVGHFRAIYLKPDELELDVPKWQTIFQRLFR